MTTYTKGARFILAPFFIAASSAVWAEVPVVDLGSRQVTVVPAVPSATAPARHAAAVTTAPAGKPDQLAILFDRLQALQQEVLELRGQLEQQQNELQQLRQQQKDNYLDVDKRLAELYQRPSVSATAAPSASLAELPLTAVASTTAGEKESYDQAYGLLDKNRREEAVLAFRKHLILYPQGELAPNAYYWLGQIYLSQGQFVEAEEQLSVLLKQYPQHHKVPDAKFALGKVYFQQGKKTEARKFIEEVAQGNTPAAVLAKKYLQDNF